MIVRHSKLVTTRRILILLGALDTLDYYRAVQTLGIMSSRCHSSSELSEAAEAAVKPQQVFFSTQIQQRNPEILVGHPPLKVSNSCGSALLLAISGAAAHTAARTLHWNQADRNMI